MECCPKGLTLWAGDSKIVRRDDKGLVLCSASRLWQATCHKVGCLHSQ